MTMWIRDFCFIYYGGVVFQRSGETGSPTASRLLVFRFSLMGARVVFLRVLEAFAKVILYPLYSLLLSWKLRVK